jgi:hypothetical protein
MYLITFSILNCLFLLPSKHKFFIFDEVLLINFSFVSHAVDVTSKNLLLSLRSWKFAPMFSPKASMVLKHFKVNF